MLAVPSVADVRLGHFELLRNGKMGRFADVVVLTAGEGSSSDFGGFRQRQCVIDINSQVSNGALDFTVSDQQLDRPQVARGLVDEGRLCAAKRMGAVGSRPTSAAIANPSANCRKPPLCQQLA